MACPALSKLILYLQNREARSEHTEIYEHLSTRCPDCFEKLPWIEKVLAEVTKHRLLRLSVENLRWLEAILATVVDDSSFEFSEEAITVIVAQFKEQAAPTQRSIRQYIAELIFEKVLLPQFADTRPHSEEVSGRRALYHAEGYDIDLRFVLDKNNGERLIGQVRPDHWDTPELPQFKVQLLQRGSLISAT